MYFLIFSSFPDTCSNVYSSFQPVNMYAPSEAGFCDVFGNVWEWGEDHFNGFGEFKAHLLYDDFSSPCFDGRHNMILVCDE